MLYPPAVIIPSRLCYESYNYASKKDFVPKLDLIGRMRYGKELIFLDPHPDAENHDHGFDSPTFQDWIQYHIRNYCTEYGGQR